MLFLANSALLLLGLVFPRTAVCVPLAARSCGASYAASTSYVGCYTDVVASRVLPFQITTGDSNTPQYCANQCGAAGYTYAGVEYGSQCFCGKSIGSSGTKSSDSSCNEACAGGGSETCGAAFFISIYSISNPSSTPAMPDCSSGPLCSNSVCDTSMSIQDRAAALVQALTLDEKIANVQSTAAGSPRLGLPAYEWWNEALHGVATSPGVLFQPSGDFSYATSFPMPITMAAAFDDPLINSVAGVVGSEARAYFNYGFAGLDFWTPNINPFRDPRWGRGMETPGEDVYHIQSYVYNLVTGLQGGVDPEVKQIISTCKHYAAYDIEDGRTSNDLDPTAQDLAEFYTPGFKSCTRDAKAGAVMCSYNAIDGIPGCANEYLLQNVLRESWNWSAPYNWVTSDCDAVANVDDPHNYVTSLPEAAAVSLNAGTDLDCGTAYGNLSQAIEYNLTTEAVLDQSLTRLYASLVQAGYFDPPGQYSSLSWSDVNTGRSQSLALQAALEGSTLLKNNGLLPLPKAISNVAVIGPWANATLQLQGNYQGIAPFLVSPLSAFQAAWSNVAYVQGTEINTADTSGFADAVSAAQAADYVVYLGGIDTTIEFEGEDRQNISWPGNQLDLIGELAGLGKPLVVVQCGGGQIDDSTLLNNTGVDSILWVGYPGQDGGNAIIQILTGVWSVAGRLPITQYPASYADDVSIYNMNLRPDGSYPGRTYKWYTGTPVLPFGYGLHYTNFTFSWASTPATSYSISNLVSGAGGAYPDIAPFVSITANVQNTGGPANIASDYVGLLFLSTTNAGPSPYPNKQLVGYGRLHNVPVGSTQQQEFNLNLNALARADTNGNSYIYPGDYTLALDIDSAITFDFSLTGSATLLEAFPQQQPNPVAAEPLGCYTDHPTRTLAAKEIDMVDTNSPQLCIDECSAAGYPYAGVEYGKQCFCDNSIQSGGVPAASRNCNYQCPGDADEMCGGYYYINIYNSTLPTTLQPATTA